MNEHASSSATTVVHDTEYLAFWEVPSDRKTGVWHILSKRSGELLGTVKWYGAWRQYCFWPEHSTIFNRGCLDDINVFMDTQMRMRQAS